MKAVRSLVLVSGDPDSVERGAQAVYQRLQTEIERFGLEEEIATTMAGNAGCHATVPAVIIYPEAVIYGPIAPDDVHALVKEHLIEGRVATGLLASERALLGHVSWLSSRQGTLPAQQRNVLARIGIINPEEIGEYIIHDGYTALAKALTEMTPREVIEEIGHAGLQGRGGAGFPTALKWRFVAQTDNYPKAVICNADESEPGTFKDRTLLEGDPHSIIEAMVIAGWAVAANIGYIYIRGEYTVARERFSKAIAQAKETGFLGKDILGSGFDFDIHIHSGAGAYICGEETALIESIEGKRGEPRTRPPYPTTHGLWGKPTLVNNVETLANVLLIVRNGAYWYRQFGTSSSPGTKVYSVLGNVNVRELIEVSMGITLREVIAIYGKGMKNGAAFKLAQTGGSSGSVVPACLQDTPLDFDAVRRAGVSLGSGALLICDESTCVVDLAIVLSNFFKNESCGKCTPCRVGTVRSHQILSNIAAGTAQPGDLEDLELVADGLAQLSHCGLGQTASTPIRDILRHFRAEVEAHIRLQVCPTGICPMRERDVESTRPQYPTKTTTEPAMTER